MANPIDHRMKTGTIGELLVQLRLLQYGIQSAPPLKDSGNDLIALKGRVIKLIQVKTTANNTFPKKPGKKKMYDLLAIVHLNGYDEQSLKLDASHIYLIPKQYLNGIASFNGNIEKYEISQYISEAFKAVEE